MAEIDWASPKTAEEAPEIDWASPKEQAQPSGTPTRWDSLSRGAAQGLTLGFGDELAGALTAIAPVLDREAAGEGKSIGERYRHARDFYRGLNKAAEGENPKTYLAGEVAGGAAPALPGGVLAKSLKGAKGVALAAGQGALQGAGYSENDGWDLARDTALGGALGTAGYGAGKVLGAAADRVASLAGRKAGQAVGEQAAKINAAKEAELRSAVSSLGGKTQDQNRIAELFIRLLDEEKSGALTPELREGMEQFRQSPDFAKIVNKLASGALERAPTAVEKVEQADALVKSLKSALPESVAKETADLTSAREALGQVGARAKRYLVPAATGAALGYVAGDDWKDALGGAGGGLVLRPMMHSLIRMRNNPAVRNVAWSAIEKVAHSAPAAIANKAIPAGAAAAGTAAILRNETHPAVEGANTGESR